MASGSSISVETPIQCSPDKFFNFFYKHSYLLPQACEPVVKKIDLVSPTTDWVDAVGSTKKISVVTSGDKLETIKNVVAAINVHFPKKITFDVLQGPMQELYNSMKFTLEVKTSNKVKWTIEYVKEDPSSEEPVVYIGLFAKVNYGVDNYIQTHPQSV